MRLLLKILRFSPPGFVRKRELRKLIASTSSALGRPVPSTAGLSAEECLMAYARFTKSEVDALVTRGADLRVLQERLFREAQRFGMRYRSLFGVSSLQEASDVDRFLYRCLGIDVLPGDPRELTVSRCFFSAFYTPETCRFISALDDGLFEGLSGGGRLRFTDRITEGHACCKATVVNGSDLS